MVTLNDLKSIAPLAQLPDTRLERLTQFVMRLEYAPGQIIFLEGDPAEGIWFILEGRVRIIKQSENGRIQALCVTRRGKCFGGCPLFDGEINPANAQAIDQVTLLLLDSVNREKLSQNDPQLLWALLQIFSERLSHLARLGEGLGAWKVTTRINDCLIAHANLQNEVSLTHDKIAEMVGSVREVVTRHLATLSEEGIVNIEPGRILLLDPDTLRCGCLASNVT
jgi:CRP/FNR family transcriptional regulator